MNSNKIHKNHSEYDIIYAFIDVQNLHLGTSKDKFKDGKVIYHGWRVDLKRFRVYLKDKLRVKEAFMFLGYISKYKKMYTAFERYGFKLVFRKTVQHHGVYKGNVDTEMVLYASNIEYNNYDRAVFVSGDGDFLSLYRFLESKNKLERLLIPNRLSDSSLLHQFYKKKIYLNDLRPVLELRQKNGGRTDVSRR